MPIDVATMRKNAIDATTTALANSLNVAQLTPEQAKVVADAVDARLDAAVKRKALSIATQTIGTKSVAQSLQDLVAVQQNLQAAQLDVALQNNASILFKTYSAFKNAGFSDDQSFQLLLGQVRR